MNSEPVYFKHHADEPYPGSGLQDDDRPKIKRPAGGEEKSVGGRAAGNESAFEQAREIAAGIIFQERKTVPKGRQKQHQHGGKIEGELCGAAGQGGHFTSILKLASASS